MEISDVTGNKRPLPQDDAEAESPTSKKSRTDSSPSSLTSSQLAQTLSQNNTQIFIADNSINYLMFDEDGSVFGRGATPATAELNNTSGDDSTQNDNKTPHFIGGVRTSRLTEPPISDINKISVAKFRHLAHALRKSTVKLHHIPGQKNNMLPLPDNLPEELKKALIKQGFSSLYSHQVESRNKIKQNKDVMITTPTSSGKTLCFNIPAFEILLGAPEKNSVLYIFPLNALAKDQEEKIRKLNAALPPQKQLRIFTITGELSRDQRIKLFQQGPPHILITNPEILHHQLIKLLDPQWTNWREFIARLKLVILDEAHTYCGSLGTHMTNIIRRLFNAVESLGGNTNRIQFILASATVGNSTEMALKLISRESHFFRLHWVKESGASTSDRTIVCLAAESSPQITSARIICSWIKDGFRGIVFCNTINAVNSLVNFIRGHPEFREYHTKIRTYYASLPEDQKKQILNQLKRNEIKMVITTNALEAGIDIAELDVCLLRGYPGSRMSFWQRIGRVGRAKPGLVVFLPSQRNAMDFYFAENPAALLSSDMENVSFNPNYPKALEKHLHCCCVESGLMSYNIEKTFGNQAFGLLHKLSNQRSVWTINLSDNSLNDVFKDKSLQKSIKKWVGNGFPHREISIRGDSITSPGNQKEALKDKVSAVWIQQDNREAVIEVLSARQALTRLFPGAVFMSQDGKGDIRRFEVTSLDMKTGRALLKLTEKSSSVRTKPLKRTTINITKVFKKKSFSFLDNPSATVNLTFGWGTATDCVYGAQTIDFNNNNQMHSSPLLSSQEVPNNVNLSESQGDEDIAIGVKPANELTYDKPFEISYEAPCLEIAFSDNTKKMLNAKFQKIMAALDTRMNERRISDPEITTRFLNLKKYEGWFIAMHSLIHQVQQVIPLLLLQQSHQDIEEQDISPLGASGYLVDSVDGGTGACQLVFEKFKDFVDQARTFSQTCANCAKRRSEGWGCALCLYSRSFCFCNNEGLLSVMGAPLFRLQEIKEKSRSLRSSVEISPPPPSKLHLSAEDIALPSSQNSQSQKEKIEEKILSPIKNTLRRSDSEVIASPVKKSLDFSSIGASPSKSSSASQSQSQSYSLISSPVKQSIYFASQSAFEILPTPSPFKSQPKFSNINNVNAMPSGRSGLMQSYDAIPFLPLPVSEKTDLFYSEAFLDEIQPSMESDFDLSAQSNNNNTNANNN